MNETENSLQLMERRIAIIMRIGVGLAMAVMIVGLVIFLWTPVETTATTLPAMWLAMWQGDGVAWMMMGLFILILTPVLRVVSTIVYFIHAGDKTYTVITVIVFIILLVGMYYGAAH